jgi:glycosyltransferase involved in cell wall biosynthesis
MTIGIYGRGLANRAGIGRYSRELVRAMLREPRGHRLRLFVGEDSDAARDPALADVVVPLRGGGNRLTEEQIALPIRARRERLDLFFTPDFTLPILSVGARRTVVTVHDVAYRRFPESNSRNSRLLLNGLVPLALRRVDAVVADSGFTKREIVDVYGIAPGRIKVVPIGVEPRFTPASDAEVARVRSAYGLPSDRLVLYVGSIEPRKNVVRLAEAVADLPGITLAVAGGDARGAADIRARISARLGDRVRFLGYFPDGDMPALYSAASVFAYPSLYEGFGLQPLEAMGCGTPVAVSRAEPMPEVGGDAVETFDPLDVAEIRETLARLLEDAPRRAELRERGFRRVESFRWPDVARRMFELFERISD